MSTALTAINPMNFPGADHVSPQGDGGYVAYGPEKDGIHRAIAILRAQPGGKYLVEATPTVISKLGSTTSVSAVGALAAWPIHETIVEVKTSGRSDSIAARIGAKPVSDMLHGRRVISTKPATGWTMKKMLDLEYEIAKPVIEEDEIEAVEL